MTVLDLRAILIVVLCVVTVAGGFYVFVFPYLSGEAVAEKRHAQITNGAGGRRAGAGVERVVDAAARRKQVTESLKELEQRHAEKKKISLETRIAQSGLDLTRTNFLAASVGLALAVTVLLFLITGSPLLSAAGVIIGGMGTAEFHPEIRDQAAPQEIRHRIPQRHRRHHPRRQGRPAAERLRPHHRIRIVRTGALGVSPDRRGPDAWPDDHRGDRALAAAHPDSGGEFLRHRHRHPAEVGRQSRRGPEQSRRACCASARRCATRSTRCRRRPRLPP